MRRQAKVGTITLRRKEQVFNTHPFSGQLLYAQACVASEPGYYRCITMSWVKAENLPKMLREGMCACRIEGVRRGDDAHHPPGALQWLCVPVSKPVSERDNHCQHGNCRTQIQLPDITKPVCSMCCSLACCSYKSM